jgi:PAS domain S-box-containing protein
MSNDGNKAQEALTIPEQEHRLLVDTIPTLVWRAGPEGDIDYVNKRVLEYLGATLDDVVGWGWAERVHPEDVAFKARNWLTSLETENPHDVVCRFRGADGRYRWFNVRGEPLRASDGTVLSWYGVLIDIDERKKAEELLRRSEAHLAEAQRLSHSGVSAYNETAILYGSKETYRIWGFDPAQGVPSLEAMWGRIHPDDLDRHRAQVRRALDEKTRYSIAYRIVLPDGTVKHLESIGQPVFSGNGELKEVVATQIDVTERKRAEQTLRESEAKIRRLVDANIIGILIWDFDGRILEANEAFLNIVGYDREDLVAGRIRWSDLTPPEWHDSDTRLIQEHKASGTLQPFEKEYFRKDGSRVPVLIGVATFEESENQGVAFVLDLTERKQAEQALRRSEAYLADSQRLSHTGTWALNTATMQYSYWSDEMYRIWGLDPLLGPPSRETLRQRIHPDDRDGVWEKVQQALHQKKDYAGEFRILLPDGTVKYLTAISHHVFSTNGKLVEVVGTNVDVTERKRGEQALRGSEEALRRSEAHLAEAQRLSHTGAVVYNGTEILFASEETYRIWGFDPAQGLPSREVVFQRIHPGDRDELNAEVRRAVNEKRRFSIAYRILLPDGTVKHLETIGEPVFSASGKLVEIFATQTDVTERKRAEEALLDSEEALRRNEAWLTQAQSLSHTGSWVMNATTNVYLYWSDESYRIWGFDPLQGLPSRENMWQRIHPDDRDGVREAVEESLRQKNDFKHEFRISLPDGTVKYLEATTSHVFSALGALVEAVSSHVDVTERKLAQEEHERLRQLESDLAHMNRLSMMGELASSLAHEIAQPIATARNNARAAMHFLDRSPPDPGQVREAITCVVDDADRAGDILDRIRDHIKKAPPRKERVDLNQAINDVIALAQGAIIKNGVSVQTRLAEGLSHVQADRVQLQQVVLNLILNAVEAMSSVKKGVRELSITTEPHQTGSVLGTVRDSGPGINQEHLDRVFDAFYTTKSSGLGMGLSICRSIIEAHEGRLWVDINESGGAVFQFTLPAVQSLT